jgi:hypothetical protein
LLNGERFPDLTSLDFLFWGCIKSAVYRVAGQAETLKHGITVAIETETSEEQLERVYRPDTLSPYGEFS